MDYNEDPGPFCRSCSEWAKTAGKRKEQIEDLTRLLLTASNLVREAALLELARVTSGEVSNLLGNEWVQDVEAWTAEYFEMRRGT